MKNSLFLTISLLLGASTQAQTTVFTEDFESGLGPNWIVQIVDTFEVDTTTIAEDFADGWVGYDDIIDTTNTNHCVGATSYFLTPGKANRWLISPAVTLGAYGNILNWRARSHDPSYPDAYKILISTTDQNMSSFDTLNMVTEEYEDWTEYSINLSDSGYVSQTIYFAFQIDSYDRFLLFLDDINVVIEDPVGLAEQAEVDFTVFPNPATDVVSIKTTEALSSVTIIDAIGNRIPVQTATSVDISALSSGMYWLEVGTDSGIGRKRFVKK